MVEEDDDLLREFLIESYENLDRLDGEFVALESDPGSKEILSSIFRTIHTIKGMCGFLDLSRLEAVTHAGENLLSALRDARLALNDEITTVLLRLVDAVRSMLAHIEETGQESEATHADLIATLQGFLDGGATEAPSNPEAPAAASAEDQPVEGDPEEVSEGADADDCDEPELDLEPEASGKEETSSAPTRSRLSGSNIRVQVEQLDELMNLAGELVLARNQIVQSAARSQDSSSVATAQRLNLITTELQERIMKVRMQPVGILWGKFPRVVRDISHQLGKQVQLRMQGKGTELDKTLLEAINDPLTHLVRNAIDHGLELPEVRKAAGKDPVGRLLLDAYHESGQVYIEITDDGAGIDAERVKAKALASGLITADEAQTMSDRQAYSLVFQAGLSTAGEVTNLSGRGVGMDVVKTNIEKIGGTVEIRSQLGRGTTVRIKIPLTLAIIPALIVTTSGDRYAVPQVSLVELVRLDGETARKGIEDLHGSPVYRLRGDLLPLLYLDEQLSVQTAPEPSEDQVRNIVVVRAGNELFGLVVDEINDTEEIVVKPLGQQTKSVPVYAGTTILGDGRVALILDVLGLAHRAGVVQEENADRRLDDYENDAVATAGSRTLLLLKGERDRHLAIELHEVDRLEEFPADSIEVSGSQQVVQYRGEIMPLLPVWSALHESPPSDPPSDNVHVVVHSRNGRSVGLVVSGISDIVEVHEPVERPSSSPGMQSAIVVDGVVTDLLSLEQLLDPALIASEDDGDAQRAQDTAAEVGARQFCTFYLEDLFFGVDVTQVQEVMRYQEMTRVPLTTDVVSGLINLRGQTVTALDMRLRLELPPYEGDERRPMNLVLRTREGVVSILVDRIGDVLTLEDSLKAPVPNTVRPEVRGLLTGVYKLENQLLLPLDIEQLVDVVAHEEVA